MPSATASAAVIPVIDVASPTPEVASQLLDAASTHGFVFVSNYGAILPPEHIRSIFELVAQKSAFCSGRYLTSQVS